MAILASNVTANVNNQFKVKSFTLLAGTGNIAVAQTADTELIGGTIVGVYYACPTNDADQIISNTSLASTTGIVSIRTSANTTADVVINVVVALATGAIA